MQASYETERGPLRGDGVRRRMPFRPLGSSRRSSEGGFILTMELLILLTIFGICIYYALQLYQQHLIDQIDPSGGPESAIYDNAPPLGGGGAGTSNAVTRAETYTSTEAPAFLYRPPGQVGGPGPLPQFTAALLGIRTDGFTSRQHVYFEGSATCNAVGNAIYLLDPTAPSVPFGPISDIYALQGVVFAMGPAVDFSGTSHPAGTLYRAETKAVRPPIGPGGIVTSEWSSEKYDDPATVADERCSPVAPATANNPAFRAQLIRIDQFFGITNAAGNEVPLNLWMPASSGGFPAAPTGTIGAPNIYAPPGNESTPPPKTGTDPNFPQFKPPPPTENQLP